MFNPATKRRERITIHPSDYKQNLKRLKTENEEMRKISVTDLTWFADQLPRKLEFKLKSKSENTSTVKTDQNEIKVEAIMTSTEADQNNEIKVEAIMTSTEAVQNEIKVEADQKSMPSSFISLLKSKFGNKAGDTQGSLLSRIHQSLPVFEPVPEMEMDAVIGEDEHDLCQDVEMKDAVEVANIQMKAVEDVPVEDVQAQMGAADKDGPVASVDNLESRDPLVFGDGKYRINQAIENLFSSDASFSLFSTQPQEELVEKEDEEETMVLNFQSVSKRQTGLSKPVDNPPVKLSIQPQDDVFLLLNAKTALSISSFC